MSKHRLLLVEDDFDVAEMLVMFFESTHYEVMHADTGGEGIELARTRFPNLILLDVMLPDMDGYQVCAQLRSMSLTKFIQTLFLTQRDERASTLKGLELGADDYITKPFDIDELRLRVEGAIKRATRENLHEPRTGLPTGPLVAEELRQRVQAGASELRLRLKGFSAYSDVYSFMAANDVLYHAAKTIRDSLAAVGTHQDFIGIDDKDHFIIATHADAAALRQHISSQFDQQVRTFYTFADADRGGILLDAGTDRERIMPIMALAPADEEDETLPASSAEADEGDSDAASLLDNW